MVNLLQVELLILLVFGDTCQGGSLIDLLEEELAGIKIKMDSYFPGL
jgi:hypothetical protein